MIDLRQGDCLEVMRTLPDESVHCIVTSPPYWGLRDYGSLGQLGLEPTFAEYLSKLVVIFEECRRVLRKDGTCWVNMGDSYSSGGRGSHGSLTTKQASNSASRGVPRPNSPASAKNLIGQPWRLAFALQDAGWILRSDIIWHKPNPMPESVTDRPTRAHEYVFLFVKSQKYWYDADAIRTVPTPQSPIALDWSRETLEPDRPCQGYSQKRASRKMPDGWDTGEGAHGTIHRSGREKGTTKSGKNELMADQPGSASRKVVGLNERYDEREAQGVYDNRGANARTVWTIPTQGYPDAHFATFPEELPKRCILAGCPEGGTVLDIFAGSGTTLAVAIRLGRKALGIELNPEYVELARQRIAAETPSLFVQ